MVTFIRSLKPVKRVTNYDVHLKQCFVRQTFFTNFTKACARLFDLPSNQSHMLHCISEPTFRPVDEARAELIPNSTYATLCAISTCLKCGVQNDKLRVVARLPRRRKCDRNNGQSQRSVLYPGLESDGQPLLELEAEYPGKQESNGESDDWHCERRDVGLPQVVVHLGIDLTLDYTGDEDQHQREDAANLSKTYTTSISSDRSAHYIGQS